MMKTAQSFWVWFQGLSIFEQICFTVLSVGAPLFIFYLLAKNSKMIMNRLCKWISKYQSFRYRTLWEPVALSIIASGIFIHFFGEKLLMEMDQDTLRNLILVTAGVIGWYFLYQRTKTADQSKKAAEQSAEATRKNTEISEEGLTVERLTRAMEQLAHEKSYVRVGGIRGLERIAYTEKEDNVKIAQILATFIQTQAAKNSKRTQKDVDDFSTYRAQRLDIEAAVHALANIASIMLEEYFEKENSKPKRELCDLRNIDLRGLRLNGINLSGFDLLEADFSHAHLQETDFNRANIGSINNKKENMTKFISANLEDAIFNNASILFTDFNHSTLTGAAFHNAYLGASTLDECCVNRTNFETSKGLTQEQIDKVFYYDNDSLPSLPEGFNPPRSRPSPIPAPINAESNNPSTKNDEQNT